MSKESLKKLYIKAYRLNKSKNLTDCPYSVLIDAYFQVDESIWEISENISNHLESCIKCQRQFQDLCEDFLAENNKDHILFESHTLSKAENLLPVKVSDAQKDIVPINALNQLHKQYRNMNGSSIATKDKKSSIIDKKSLLDIHHTLQYIIRLISNIISKDSNNV